MNSLTFRLFAIPSFCEGLARAFDLGGTMEIYNESAAPTAADYYALASDWKTVGNDILSASRMVMGDVQA